LCDINEEDNGGKERGAEKREIRIARSNESANGSGFKHGSLSLGRLKCDSDEPQEELGGTPTLYLKLLTQESVLSFVSRLKGFIVEVSFLTFESIA
jgi:hypothetical protein